MGVFKAGISQPEMVEPVVQDLAGNGDAERSHVGEIRKTQTPRLLHLAENDLLLLAVKGAPGPDTSFKRAAHALCQIGMPA